MTRQQLATYQLPLFFVLAFAITWTAQIATYLYADAHDLTVTNEANVFHIQQLFAGTLDPGFIPYLLVFSFAFGPSVAGIIVTALVRGRAGLRDLWKQLSTVRIPRRWLITILVIPFIWNSLALLLGAAATGFAPIDFDLLVPLHLALPFLLYLIIFTGLAEEIGWRGYALPELQRHYTAEKASWILGILWGLWHIPSVLLVQYLDGGLLPQVALTLTVALTVGIVGWTIVITWLYNNTGSLFWIIILHGLANFVQSYLILSTDNQPAMALWPLLPWAFALYLLKRYGGKTLVVRSSSA